LRERAEDIPLLANHFLARAARGMGRPLGRIGPAAMKRLRDYAWPGNVRELQNAIERALVVRKGEEVKPDDLPVDGKPQEPAAEEALRLSDVERIHIQRVLDLHKGNVTRAAKDLAIDRVTLYNKIRKYDLKR